MTIIPKQIQQAKGSAHQHKQLLTAVHRVVDAYLQGRGASACMDEIKKILGRK